MVVLILEKTTASLRGEISRWMIEPRTNVFVARMTSTVRDQLWEKVCKAKRIGGAVLIHAAQNEQGFTVKTHGDPTREIVDLDGLTLVRIPPVKHRKGKIVEE